MVNNVQAGEYMLAVRVAASSGQPAQEARQMIQVAGTDIDGSSSSRAAAARFAAGSRATTGHRCRTSIDCQCARDR